MKKLISVLLSVIMALSLLSVAVSAEETPLVITVANDLHLDSVSSTAETVRSITASVKSMHMLPEAVSFSMSLLPLSRHFLSRQAKMTAVILFSPVISPTEVPPRIMKCLQVFSENLKKPTARKFL